MDFYLVAYDIPADKRRTQVANVLEDYGLRVQYSVFEVWLDARLHTELLRRLNAVIDPHADSVRLYHLCAVCQTRITVLGLGAVPQPPGPIVL